MRLGPGLAMLLLAGCASLGERMDADRVGRIYSYVRSNSDGSEAETIHVYRARREHLQVTKMRDRCTNAAFVTADLDLASGQAIRLTGGRLRPNARHEDFALLTWDPAARRIDAVARPPGGGGELRQSVTVPDQPWHLYDFDLASLTVTAQYRPRPREAFSFGLPLTWLGDDPADFLRYLGRPDARFVREENLEGRRALRFEVGGPAFGGKGGPLWLDSAEGHVLGAQWGIPNHAEYRDFKLRLTDISDGGAEAWRRLLAAHFEGCPVG
jgi:hypothetical protein